MAGGRSKLPSGRLEEGDRATEIVATSLERVTTEVFNPTNLGSG